MFGMYLNEWRFNNSIVSESLKAIEEKIGFNFPQNYFEFMLTHNGGEGFVGEQYFTIWKHEDLIQYNADYHVTEHCPDVFMFGSNGGGEGFAFAKNLTPIQIVLVPFIGMDKESAIIVGSDIDELFKADRDKIFTQGINLLEKETK